MLRYRQSGSVIKEMGEHIARLRKARRLLHAEAAVRANMGRKTVSRIENGDASVAIGQIGYLNVIAGIPLTQLYYSKDAALTTMEQREKRQRARKLSPKAPKQYEF